MSILIWNFLFSNGEFPSRILRDFFGIALFSEKMHFRRSFIFEEALFSKKLYFRRSYILQLYFSRSYFFTLLQYNYFDMAATFWEQLSLQSSCFLRGAPFSKKSFSCSIYFFRILIFLSETSTKQPLIENRKCFREVSSRNSYFFGARITYSKVIYRRALLFKQVLLHSISFYRRVTFSKKLTFQKRSILNYLLFLKSYLFRVATFQQTLPSIAAFF